MWCSPSKNNTLNTTMCGHKDEQNGVKRIADEKGNRSKEAAADYVFRMEDAYTSLRFKVDLLYKILFYIYFYPSTDPAAHSSATPRAW